MENFVLSIGGYNSWQFAVISLGSMGIGLGLYIFRWYLFPIIAFDIMLFYLYLDEEVTKIVPENHIATLIPVVYCTIMIVILVGIKQINDKRNL